MKTYQPICSQIKRHEIANPILKRIIEEYEVILGFLRASHDPAIGFWTAIRMIMPIVETAGKIEGKTPTKLLEDLGVPKSDIAWTMFRDGLSHGEIPFLVEDASGVKYGWAITFNPKHGLIRQNINPPYFKIEISTLLLLSDLKAYLEKFTKDDTEVSIQTGKKLL